MLVRLRRCLRAEGRDRGAVAVEAALITPFFLLLIFGIVEISLLIKDNVAVVSATRAGARTASSLSHQSTFLTATAAQMTRATANLNRTSATVMWVYKANGNGGKPPAACLGTAGAECVPFTWDTGSQSFVATNAALAQWPPSKVDACPISPTNIDGPDSVGVWMTTTHTWLTPLFPNSTGATVTDYSALNFEPVPLGASGTGCAAS